MARLLACIVGPAEVETALAGGADALLVVGPQRGPVAPGVLRAIVAAAAGRRPVGAAMGHVAAQSLAAAVQELAAAGADAVRVPLDAECLDEIAARPLQAKLVAVLPAEAPPDRALLARLATTPSIRGAMLDTNDKSVWGDSAGRLLDQLDIAAIARFVDACHDHGLVAELAGGLEPPDIPRLLVLAPDALAFRGALCGPGGRGAPLDLGHVQAVRALIPPITAPPKPGSRDVDYRLLAPRSPSVEEFPADRVFVDDLVLPAHVGAYVREHAAAQRVRFAVEAWVARGRSAEDMRDVFSYDLITDGIRMLVASGHFALVETLAERIAAMVLAHPRVQKVMVRVQKLETGSGIVGVGIERTRPPARGATRPVVPLLAEATSGGAKGGKG